MVPHLRSETPGDRDAITAVLDAAFGGTTESLLVDLIRRSDGFVPHLSIVAEIGDAVVGHVMLSRVTIRGDQDFRVLSLAPLAVHPDHQNAGIGTALVEEGLRRADADGEPLVVVEGHPGYYPRFGFLPAHEHGIERPAARVPLEAFKVRPLAAYSPTITGRLVYPAPFHEADAIGP